MFRSLFGSRSFSKIPSLNAQELADKIKNDNNLLLIDVRSPGEYQFDGHIAGSRLLPLQTLSQRMAEIPKDKTIICICRSGNRSQVACEQLSHAGYTDVINFRDGMVGWRRAGYPHQ